MYSKSNQCLALCPAQRPAIGSFSSLLSSAAAAASSSSSSTSRGGVERPGGRERTGMSAVSMWPAREYRGKVGRSGQRRASSGQWAAAAGSGVRRCCARQSGNGGGNGGGEDGMMEGRITGEEVAIGRRQHELLGCWKAACGETGGRREEDTLGVVYGYDRKLYGRKCGPTGRNRHRKELSKALTVTVGMFWPIGRHCVANFEAQIFPQRETDILSSSSFRITKFGCCIYGRKVTVYGRILTVFYGLRPVKTVTVKCLPGGLTGRIR
ncbi:hypothetical protein DFH09DRAFT_1089869 [Mycena vulgaris]|nr:hypothetical protein DFH09DRAFT_1089869 [Mycena vulgaris]